MMRLFELDIWLKALGKHFGWVFDVVYNAAPSK